MQVLGIMQYYFFKTICVNYEVEKNYQNRFERNSGMCEFTLKFANLDTAYFKFSIAHAYA